MDLRELRNIRLNHEHDELMMLNGDVIQIEPLGKKPYSRYRIVFNIRTFTSNIPTYRSKTTCILDIPVTYPQAAPTLTVDGCSAPFHVNWFKTGRWCFGSWNQEEPLANFVLRAARTLRNDPELVNVNSPANRDAVCFWNRIKDNKRMVPSDNKTLPAMGYSGTIEIVKQATLGKIQIHTQEKPKISILPKAEDEHE